jgi:lipopolysaccharide transport system permease protein
LAVRPVRPLLPANSRKKAAREHQGSHPIPARTTAINTFASGANQADAAARQAATPSGALPHAARRGRSARYLRDLTLHLVGRALARRHRRSLFGWAWSLALPVAQLAIFSLVFGRILPLNVHNYAAFLFVGISSWTWFSTSTTLAVGSLEGNRSLVLRPRFPAAILPVTAVLTGLVDYLFALPVLLVILGIQVGLSWSVLALVPLAAIQLLLCAAVAWIVAPLNVFFRDVQHAVTIALLLGFYLTPVFYEPSAAPSSLSWIYTYNPMARLIEAQRAILLDGTWPKAGPLILLALVLLAAAAAGFAAFRRVQHRLPDEL